MTLPVDTRLKKALLRVLTADIRMDLCTSEDGEYTSGCSRTRAEALRLLSELGLFEIRIDYRPGLNDYVAGEFTDEAVALARRRKVDR